MIKYLKRFLPKKQISLKEFSVRLYQMSLSPEAFDLMTENLLSDEKNSALFVEDEILDFNLTALTILAIDYSNYLAFGDISIKKKILDEFYKLIKETFPADVYNLLIVRVSELYNVLKEENPNTPYLKLGNYFSKLISKEGKEDIMVGLEVTSLFGARVISLTNFIEDVKDNFKLSDNT